MAKPAKISASPVAIPDELTRAARIRFAAFPAEIQTAMKTAARHGWNPADWRVQTDMVALTIHLNSSTVAELVEAYTQEPPR